MDTPLIDDDHIIELLRKDAEAGRFGSSFKAEKRDKNAPKPNTRFLRNLVRDADSHNAALLAKEKAETRARLRGLESAHKRGREDEQSRGDDSLKRQRRGQEREGRWKGVLSGLGGPSKCERNGERRRDTNHNSIDQRTSHSTRRTNAEDVSQETKHLHRRRRSRSSNSRSTSPRHRQHNGRDRDRRSQHRSRSREPKDSQRHHRNRDRRSRSPDDRRGHVSTEKPSRHRRERSRERLRRSRSPVSLPPKSTTKPTPPSDSDSDSDPLDPLLGPALPPKTRPRGRGATANRSTMDLRFNDPNYNPRTDVALSDPEEDKDSNDPWSTSLEALRDRAAWRAKGAQRLREVGFGEGDVAKFEGGGRLLEGGREKDERDLKWRGQGEGREWDAGKTVGGEQEERQKAAWTKGIGL